MEKEFSKVLSMFGYREKLGQFFKCPMFGVEIKAW
jgi:hypothetical protein